MIDLSVSIKNVKFRNPVLPGASEIVLDEIGVERCISQGIGGIVTKTYTTTKFRTRANPHRFPLKRFGKGLETSWLGVGSFDPREPAFLAKNHVPKMKRLTEQAGIPLIINIGCSDDVGEWITEAKRFEDVGADMLELNLSCPHAAFQVGTNVGRTVGEDLDLSTKIINGIKKKVSIPISPKMSILFDYRFAKRWAEAGADCISAHNLPYGIIIDVEEEVPFGSVGNQGYMMGRAMLPWSLARIVEMKKASDVPIIGIGGIFEPQDAIMYLLLGCLAIQVAGGVFQKGYQLFGQIIKGIEDWMERKGYKIIEDFRGKVLPLASEYSTQEIIEMRWPYPVPQVESSLTVPEVNMEKCTLCGSCEHFCLYGVFKVDKGKDKVEINDVGRCWGCGCCVGWCPNYAIRLIDKITKEEVWANKGLAKPYRPESWKKK